MISHLSLFSGIGGLDLAAEAAGFTTVGQCEFAEYPRKILEKQWPDVYKWRDIRTLTGADFYAKTGMRTVDVISGGFPCQPFSVAGKQKGRDDDRYLWPEMLRVIRELAPRWVVGENVPGILRIAAGQVAQDLEREGYRVAIFDYEAAAVGAWHRRERIAFVANAANTVRRAGEPGRNDADGKDAGREKTAGRVGASSENVRKWSLADAESDGSTFHMAKQPREKDADAERCSALLHTFGERLQDRIQEKGRKSEKFERSNKRFTKSRMGGMADGLPDWVDGEPEGIHRTVKSKTVFDRANRLKALGNAVVPRQFYPIFRAIAEELVNEEANLHV